jgi:type III secretion protein J
MMARPRGRHMAASALLALLLLAGCSSKTVLYTGLSQDNANQILALLMRSGISTEKTSDKIGITVSVDSARFPEAVALLTAAGLPHQAYTNLGELFQSSGMIPSPTEERVRYIYGLSQELGHTIGMIDGVLSASVHIVLPGNDPTNQGTEPSSAAVLIRYAPDATVDTLVPRIKELIVNSVEGLSYDHVSVVLVKAAGPDLAEIQAAHRPPAAKEGIVPPLALYTMAGLFATSLLGNLSLGWLLWRRRHGWVASVPTTT